MSIEQQDFKDKRIEDIQQADLIDREKLKHHVNEIIRLRCEWYYHRIKADEYMGTRSESLAHDHIKDSWRCGYKANQHEKALGIWEEPELDVDSSQNELESIFNKETEQQQ